MHASLRKSERGIGMSMDLKELYQEIILDHNRNPRNHYAMTESTSEARGVNPLCGDKLTVYVKLQKGILEEVSFIGSGCAISQASASLMTEVMRKKTEKEAHALFHRFHAMMTQEGQETQPITDKLSVLAGVKAFPARVKCATLAWHALEAALNKGGSVSTE
jgi:nitrogen fixation protein NifU and related proteins